MFKSPCTGSSVTPFKTLRFKTLRQVCAVQLESLKLFSTAERLGLLSTLERLLVSDPAAISSISLPLFVASLGATTSPFIDRGLALGERRLCTPIFTVFRTPSSNVTNKYHLQCCHVLGAFFCQCTGTAKFEALTRPSCDSSFAYWLRGRAVQGHAHTLCPFSKVSPEGT